MRYPDARPRARHIRTGSRSLRACFGRRWRPRPPELYVESAAGSRPQHLQIGCQWVNFSLGQIAPLLLTFARSSRLRVFRSGTRAVEICHDRYGSDTIRRNHGFPGGYGASALAEPARARHRPRVADAKPVIVGTRRGRQTADSRVGRAGAQLYIGGAGLPTSAKRFGGPP